MIVRLKKILISANRARTIRPVGRDRILAVAVFVVVMMFVLVVAAVTAAVIVPVIVIGSVVEADQVMLTARW